MSDHLCTRIADAIKKADNDYAIDQTNAYLNLANSVIRELGLRREQKHTAPVQNGLTGGPRYRATSYSRYVTDWMADHD